MIIIEKILFLKRISIFKSLASKELQVIAEVTTEEEFAAGEVLFSEGQQGDCMYFVLEGRINIYSGTPPKIKVLAVFEAGDFFGEMGLYDDKPRAASAMSLDSSRLLVLRKADFCELIADYPEVALGIMKELNQRIRDTNIKLTSFEGRIIDKASRLYSREYFIECLSTELLKAKKDQQSLSIMVFKINSLELPTVCEKTELEVVDQVVGDLGRIVNMHQRPNDLSARFSERKVAVMLAEANREGAGAFARRILKDIEKLIADLVEAQAVKAQVTHLIVTFPDDSREREALLGLLDTF